MIYLYRKNKARKARVAREQRLQQQNDPTSVSASTPPVDANGVASSNDMNGIAHGNTDPKSSSTITKASPAQLEGAENEAVCVHKYHSTNGQSCPECAATKKAARIYRWKLILALIPAQFLATIDVMIVSTSLTTIASHFHQLDQFNWIVTAYTLTSTAFVPAFGQVADIWGRHTALQLSMLFMVIGSALAAGAQTWVMLIFGRAFQGLSAAGIMNIIKIILADKVTLAENAKNNSIFSMVIGVSYATGPVIGGYLVQVSWRWVFIIQVPIVIVSSATIFFILRNELVRGTHQMTGAQKRSVWAGLATFDIGGIILFVVGTCLLILGVTSGGTQHKWTSYKVLVPLIIGAICFVSFFFYEYLLEPGNLMSRVFPKQVAMIPWVLFSRKDAWLMAIVNAATGAAMYSAFYFVGIFWTLVENYSPGKAGTMLLYYTPGIGVGVYSAMVFCNFWPRQTFWPLLIGSILEGSGFAVLAWATRARNTIAVILMLAVSGAGTGLRLMPNNLHMAGIWRTKLAAAMSFMGFAMPFGGTLGIAIQSAAFYNKFESSLRGLGTEGGSIGSSSLNTHNTTTSLGDIKSLPLDVQSAIRDSAAHAIMWSFIAVLPIMALSVIAAASLGNVWIKPQAAIGSEEVLYGSYVVALLKGHVKAEKQPVDARPAGADIAPANRIEELRRDKEEVITPAE